MNCTNCNTPNAKSALFCLQCGTQLTRSGSKELRTDLFFVSFLVLLTIFLYAFPKTAFYNYHRYSGDGFKGQKYVLDRFPSSRYAPALRKNIAHYLIDNGRLQENLDFIRRHQSTAEANQVLANLPNKFPEKYDSVMRGELIKHYSLKDIRRYLDPNTLRDLDFRFLHMNQYCGANAVVRTGRELNESLAGLLSEIIQTTPMLDTTFLPVIIGYVSIYPGFLSNEPGTKDQFENELIHLSENIKFIDVSVLETIKNYLKLIEAVVPLADTLDIVFSQLTQRSMTHYNNEIVAKISEDWFSNFDLDKLTSVVEEIDTDFINEDMRELIEITNQYIISNDTFQAAEAYRDEKSSSYNSARAELSELYDKVMSLTFFIEDTAKGNFTQQAYKARSEQGSSIIIQTLLTEYTTIGNAHLYVTRESQPSLHYNNRYTRDPIPVYTEYTGNYPHERQALREKMSRHRPSMLEAEEEFEIKEKRFLKEKKLLKAKLTQLFRKGGLS